MSAEFEFNPMKALLIGAGGAFTLISLVFLTGSTFGQRCAKAFPDNPDVALVCVQRLSHDEPIDDLLATPTTKEQTQ